MKIAKINKLVDFILNQPLENYDVSKNITLPDGSKLSWNLYHDVLDLYVYYFRKETNDYHSYGGRYFISDDQERLLRERYNELEEYLDNNVRFNFV